jgi:hypothetical protein
VAVKITATVLSASLRQAEKTFFFICFLFVFYLFLFVFICFFNKIFVYYNHKNDIDIYLSASLRQADNMKSTKTIVSSRDSIPDNIKTNDFDTSDDTIKDIKIIADRIKTDINKLTTLINKLKT